MPKKSKSKTKPAKAQARPKGTNKSAFVRALPGSLSAAEVVDEGKKRGLQLSIAQVYTIRANAKRAESKGARKPAGGAAPSGNGAAIKSKGGSAQNKSEFIRSLPADMPARDVVEKAKAAGVTLTAGLVYAVRSSAKTKQGGRSMRAERTSAPSGHASREKQFVSLALDLGLSTAEALLGRVRDRLRDL